MSHRLPSLWYPEASYNTKDASIISEGGSEEGGRGSLPPSPMEESGHKRKRLPIPRRRTPTVAVTQSPASPGLSNRAKSKQYVLTLPQIVKKSETYETVEKTEDLSLLDLSSLPYRTSKNEDYSPAKKYPNWFCGWTDEEYFDLHRNTSTKAPKDVPSRSALQTPSTGIRATLYTRPSVSSAMRRRQPFKFQHFTSYDEYSEQYRTEYSYSSMFAPHKSDSDKDSKFQETSYKMSNEEASIAFPIEIKNIYHEDPYFTELISRLGIKEPPKNLGSVVDGNHQNLLRGLRPTPPSIVKKKKNVENIVISNSGKFCHGDAHVGPRPATSNGVHMENSSSSPKVSHREVMSKLPKITQTTQISHYIQNIYNEHKKKKKQASLEKQAKRCLPKAEQEDAVLDGDNHRDKKATVLEEDEYRGMSDIDEREEDVDEEQDEVPDDSGMKNGKSEKPYSKVPSIITTQKANVGPTSSSYSGKKLEPTDSKLVAAKPKMANKSSENALTPWNCLDLDPKQRDKIISDTAYLLGVGSRDWAKSYMRKLLSSEGATKSVVSRENGTRPPTRQSRAGSRLGYTSKTLTNQNNNSSNHLPMAQSRSVSRSVSRMDDRNSAQLNQETSVTLSTSYQRRSESRMDHGNRIQAKIPQLNEANDSTTTTTSIPVRPIQLIRAESRGGASKQSHPNKQAKEKFRLRTPSDIAMKAEKKIEELKSIYKPSHSRKIPVKVSHTQSIGQTSRCVSRMASRQEVVQAARPQDPSTPQDSTAKEQQSNYHITSRPGTQATGRKSRLLPIRRQQRTNNVRVQSSTSITSMDGSGLYWNELPIRPPTGSRRQKSDCTGVRVQGLAQVLPCKRSTSTNLPQDNGSFAVLAHSRPEAIAEEPSSNRSPSSCSMSLPSRLCQPKDGLSHKKLAT